MEFLDQEQFETAVKTAKNKYTTLTSNLMDAVFTREELETSSPTGFNTKKPALDEPKRDAILSKFLFFFKAL